MNLFDEIQNYIEDYDITQDELSAAAEYVHNHMDEIPLQAKEGLLKLINNEKHKTTLHLR
jgi:hypothetical protein